MRDLAGEEIEEPVELVGIAPERRRQRDRVRLRGSFQAADLQLQSVAELLYATEHVYRVAFGEARIEELHVVPDARLDSPARIDELQGEVGGPVSRSQPALARDRVDAL